VPRASISEYLDFTVTSAEVGADKPQPPIFLKALQLAHVNAAEAIHVGINIKMMCWGREGWGLPRYCWTAPITTKKITDCPRIHSLSEVSKFVN